MSECLKAGMSFKAAAREWKSEKRSGGSR